MEKTMTKLRESRVLRCIMAAIVAIGVCTPFLSANPEKAYANDIPITTVDPNSFQAAQPLAIQNLTDWEKPYLLDKDTTVKTTYATKSAHDPSSPNAWIDMNGTMEQRRTYVHGDMFENDQAKQDDNNLGWGALVLEFTDLTTKWDTGSATVRYPYVGSYKDDSGVKQKIGADVIYTINYRPDPSFTVANQYPVLQCANSLYSGITQYNVNGCSAKVVFFDYATKQPVEVKNSFFTIGSLTGAENSNSFHGEAFSCIESNNRTSSIVLADGSSVSTLKSTAPGGYENTTLIYGTDMPADYIDKVDAPTFWKLSASAYQENYFQFRTYGTGWNESSTSEDNLTIQWWALSSASARHVIQTPPTKSVDKAEANYGDTLTYTVDQKVKEIGVDSFGKYESFVFTDPLPTGVSYVNGSAKVYKTENGKKTDVTAEAGSVSVNGQNVVYTFSKDYLQNKMTCNGEIYTFEIKATVNNKTQAGQAIKNNATTKIDGHAETSNKVETLVNIAKLALDKSVAPYEYQVGDDVEYKIVVNNTNANTVAKNVVVTDSSLPEGLKITGIEDVSFTGADAAVSYPTGHNEDGTLKWEDKANSAKAEANGTGFKATIGYVAYNKPITITVHATATKDVNGDEVVNTATATADNFLKTDGTKDSVSDTAKVWINTAELNIEKTAEASDYSIGNTVTYKIKVTNVKAGTIAHNIVVDDKFEQDGMQLIRNSFTVADSDGNIITNDCKVTQNLNNQNFSIATYKDLVSEAGNYQIIDNGTTTDGGKWNPLGTTKETALYIEYQAVVTDPAIAGTDIINTATASSDNSNIPEDDAVISIPDTDIPPNPPIRGSQVTTYKSSDPAPNTKVKNGDEITYTLTSKNTGSITAPYTLVRDYIPEGTTYVEGSVSEGGAYVAEDAEGNTTKKAYVEWLLTDIAVDASVNTSFKVTVNDDSPGVIENAALTSSVDRPLVPGDPSNPEPKDPSNRIEHPKTDNPTDPCIEIIKSSDPIYGTEVSSGDTVNYTLTVKNSGGSDAKDVAVYDAIPTGTDFKNIEKEYGATVAADSASLGWNIPELKAGESVDLHFTVTVNEKAAQAGIIQNQASYDMNTPGIPTTPLTNTSNIVEHPVKPGPSTDLPPKYGHEVTVYKAAEPAAASLVATGDEIIYTLNAVNTGAIAAPFTVIRDYIPEGTIYVEGSVSEGGVYVADGNYVEWVLTDIAPNAEKAVSYKVTVADNPPTWIRNTALYGDTTENPGKPGEITTEPKNETNEIIHTTDKDVPVPAVLDMAKESEPVAGTTVMNGEEITYKLTLKNNGGTAAENAGIRDYIPEGTTYVEGSVSEGGSYNAAKNCVEWTINSLEAGKDTTVSFKVIVNDGFTGTKVANQALFGNNWNGETDPGNSTNIVEHPFTPNPNNSSSHSGSVSYFDKTGEWIADHLLLLVGLALIAFAAGGAGFKLVRKNGNIS